MVHNALCLIIKRREVNTMIHTEKRFYEKQYSKLTEYCYGDRVEAMRILLILYPQRDFTDIESTEVINLAKEK